MHTVYLSVLPIHPTSLLNSIQQHSDCQLFSGDGFLNPYRELTNHTDYLPVHLLLLSPTRSVSGSFSQCSEMMNRTIETNVTRSDRFVSGWAGIIDYPSTPESEPECRFHFYPYSILIDPTKDYCLIQAYSPVNPDQLLALIPDITPENKPRSRQWQAYWQQDQYTQAFQSVHNYLLDGDCYQVNLTMPFICNDDLRHCNPTPLLSTFNAPFSFYMKDADRTVFSVTPERFLSINSGRIETRPIKGTAPRSEDPVADRKNAEDLLSSEKNRAENLMIVDLLRNDLSRSAEPDSVRVEKLFDLESHANVHHLVSTISAQMKAGLTPSDVVRSAFPGGSITGAPKKRAMEIIDELEAEPRGPYCGSAGFFDEGGYTDFNILIRTITATEEKAVCWGGGGIVIDSTAPEEYQEIFNKVQKILDTPL